VTCIIPPWHCLIRFEQFLSCHVTNQRNYDYSNAPLCFYCVHSPKSTLEFGLRSCLCALLLLTIERHRSILSRPTRNYLLPMGDYSNVRATFHGFDVVPTGAYLLLCDFFCVCVCLCVDVRCVCVLLWLACRTTSALPTLVVRQGFSRARSSGDLFVA
jgi:hypothetical protein